MKLELIPGVLALSLAAITTAAAQNDAKKPAQATTPPVEVSPATTPAIDPATIKTDSSYGLGFRTGGQFGQQYGNFGVKPGDLDMESFTKGFLEGFNGSDPSLSEEKLAAAMQALGTLLEQREKDTAAKNLEAGKAFLDENAKKPDITTTASGLQYQVIEKGGEQKYVEPKEGEPEKQFMVNYRGTLIDGTEFDASPEGEPVAMNMQVIPGFKEALGLMPVGAKWKLFIPSELAYGDQRRSPEIGPNTALIFDLELVEIQDAPPAPVGGLPFPIPGGAPEGE